VANIYASIRYANARYGSAPRGWNRAGGYDQGGQLPPGLSLAYNGTGRPEMVLPESKLRRSFDTSLKSTVVPPLKQISDGIVKLGEVSMRVWKQLLAAGWKGRAGDRMEALYRPAASRPAVKPRAAARLSAFQISNLEPDSKRFGYVKRHGLPRAPKGYTWAEDYTLVRPTFYDSGGWLKPGLTLAYNRTGRPERVLPPNRSRDGVRDVHLHIHASAVVASKRELAQLVEEARAAFKASGGRLVAA
jgi:hypothetical protein